MEVKKKLISFAGKVFTEPLKKCQTLKEDLDFNAHLPHGLFTNQNNFFLLNIYKEKGKKHFFFNFWNTFKDSKLKKYFFACNFKIKFGMLTLVWNEKVIVVYVFQFPEAFKLSTVRLTKTLSIRNGKFVTKTIWIDWNLKRLEFCIGLLQYLF